MFEEKKYAGKKSKTAILILQFWGHLSSSGSVVCLLSPLSYIRFFPVFTKRGTDIWGSELYWACVSLSLAFLEVKFLGQRFWISIAKWLSGNVLLVSAPPSLGWEGTPWAALSVVWKSFIIHRREELMCCHCSICISLIAIWVEPFKTCLFIIWVFLFVSLSIYLLGP